MTHFEGIDHITLPASDLEQAERFYVDVLGATLARRFDRETFLRYRPDAAALADADATPLRLELAFGAGLELHVFLHRSHRPGPLRPHPHTAFRVAPDELDRLTARLVERGVHIDGPRRLGPPGQASVYFCDPFGNLLELCTLGYRRRIDEGPPDLARLEGLTLPGLGRK